MPVEILADIDYARWHDSFQSTQLYYLAPLCNVEDPILCIWHRAPKTLATDVPLENVRLQSGTQLIILIQFSPSAVALQYIGRLAINNF